MIWDIIQQSAFDKHFQSESLTFQQLLTDENILTQMQNLNPLLLDYINKNLETIMTKLVQYVTVMPTQDQGYDRCHRLPYVSSEMLAINSDIFYQAFFGKQPSNTHTRFLDALFAFLKSDSADNELLLGYFQKVINNLYKGRKLQFTKSVSKNLQLFIENLDKETIGNILKDCVILLNQKQGVLFQERKKIVSRLISNFVQPNYKGKDKKIDNEKERQVKSVCSRALVEILGRYKTYSSGEELLKYMLNSNGQLLLIYSQIQSLETNKLLTGILTKSTQKLYNPELDIKQNIFRIPPQHEKLLQGYLPLRLHYCKKKLPAAPQSNSALIRQQDGEFVSKVNVQILEYFNLVAITLQNQIDLFLLEGEGDRGDFGFAWQCMSQHPKNDILLVQIDKIFIYASSNRSKNAQSIHNHLLNSFKIVQKFCDVVKNQKLQKTLRPHLFQIWTQLKTWIPQNTNKQWSELCHKYEILVPLHSKVAGLNYNRPTNVKLVVDQAEVQASPHNTNLQSIPNQQVAAMSETNTDGSHKKQIQQDPFNDNIFSNKASNKVSETNNFDFNFPDINKSEPKPHHDQLHQQVKKVKTSDPEFQTFNQQFNSQLKKMQNKNVQKDGTFNEFGDFFNDYGKNKDKNKGKNQQSQTHFEGFGSELKQEPKEKEEQKPKNDFADFDFV